MIGLKKKAEINLARIDLPGSKSISNRFLLLRDLYQLNTRPIHLSSSNDTVLMQRFLDSRSSGFIQTEDAGTVARFAVASAIRGPFPTYITGTPRLESRPFKELILALEELGADFEFPKNPYSLPLYVNGFNQKSHQINISASQSSQFTSALMMIGPWLKSGLILNLTGVVRSESYIQMTASVMCKLGLDVQISGNKIEIKPAHIKTIPEYFHVESDWSSASFFILLLAAMPIGTRFIFNDLFNSDSSEQGDRVILSFVEPLGISHTFDSGTLVCVKEKIASVSYHELNFSDCPDLALPVCFMLSGLKMEFSVRGIETLKFKESNRMEVMKMILDHMGVKIREAEDRFEFDARLFQITDQVFDPFEDHRVAMSLAILSAFGSISIQHPEVVEKSFPGFWTELSKTGIQISSS